MARKSLIKIGAAIGALSLALTACGGGGNGPAAGTETLTAADANPDGHLRFGNVYAPPHIHPYKVATATGTSPYLSPVYDRLTQMKDDDGEVALAPMVATEWEFAEDGMSTTFTLRDDVTFSDGAKLDAEAVKASLDRARGEGSTVANAFSMIESITADDPSHVTFETNRPAADLPYVLSGVEGSLVSPDALDNPDLDMKPVGSGPYVLTDYRVGDSLTYERREGYWDPEAQMAKTITIYAMPDDNTRLNALRTGQVDMILAKLGQVDPHSLGADLNYFEYPTPSATQTVLLNVDRPNVENEKFRQAMNYAVDREGMSQALTDGQCTPINQQLAEEKIGHLTDLPMDYSYNPERARELLAESGVEDPKIEILVAAGWSPEEPLANAVASQLQEVGIDATVVPSNGSQMVTNFAAGDADARVTARQAKQSPAIFFNFNYRSPGLFPGTAPDGFDDLMLEATNPAGGEDGQRESLEEVSALVNENALDIPLCTAGTLFAYSDKVIGADKQGVAHIATEMDMRYVGVAE